MKTKDALQFDNWLAETLKSMPDEHKYLAPVLYQAAMERKMPLALRIGIDSVHRKNVAPSQCSRCVFLPVLCIDVNVAISYDKLLDTVTVSGCNRFREETLTNKKSKEALEAATK